MTYKMLHNLIPTHSSIIISSQLPGDTVSQASEA